jgi:NmrA-like family
VTALTRPDSTSKLPSGVKSIVVNYDDETSLVSALKGQQFLIITMAVTAPPDTQSKLIRAAAKAGTPYVMPNWYGSDFTNEELGKAVRLGLAARATVDGIESLGVSKWVMLACGFWYEFSLAGGSIRYGFDFPSKSVTFYDDGNTKIITSTWDQCGRAVAALLSLPELPVDENDKSPTVSQFANGIVYISSFLISQKDMFESVKRVTGTTDADWKISYEESAQRYQDGIEAMKKGDMSGFGKMLYARAMFPNGDGDFSNKLNNNLLGLPKEDLDERTKVAVKMADNKEVPY